MSSVHLSTIQINIHNVTKITLSKVRNLRGFGFSRNIFILDDTGAEIQLTLFSYNEGQLESLSLTPNLWKDDEI